MCECLSYEDGTRSCCEVCAGILEDVEQGRYAKMIRRRLARELLEDFGKVRVNWERDECERVLFERLREIAGEDA